MTYLREDAGQYQYLPGTSLLYMPNSVLRPRPECRRFVHYAAEHAAEVLVIRTAAGAAGAALYFGCLGSIGWLSVGREELPAAVIRIHGTINGCCS